MIIEEIKGVLDTELSFSMPSKNPLAPFFEKAQLFALSTWVLERSQFALYYVITPTSEVTNEMKVIMETLKAQRKGDTWVIERGKGQTTGESIMDYLGKVPSAVLNYSYLDGKGLHIDLKFHHTDRAAISDIILNNLARGADLLTLEIRPTSSLPGLIKVVGAKIPLCVLGIRYKAPRLTEIGMGGKSESKFIREQRFRTDDGGVSSLFYFQRAPNSDLPESFKEISRKDGLFSSTISFPVWDFFSKSINELPLPVVSVVEKYDGANMHSETILPVSNTGRMMDIVNRARVKFPEIDVTLESLRYL
ncbi:MAG: hypothetical protein QW597_00675 [Thermoplasmataceae archaeon]